MLKKCKEIQYKIRIRTFVLIQSLIIKIKEEVLV